MGLIPKKKEKAMTDTAIERISEDEQNRHETLYDQTLAGIDMNRLVFRGDRRALVELLADAGLSSTVNRLLAELKPHNASKELLTKALKISRGMMLTLYQVVDHCARTLELTFDIEVYVNQNSYFNAACYRPAKDKVLLMLTSSLLKKFSGEEALFEFIDDSGKGHRRRRSPTQTKTGRGRSTIGNAAFSPPALRKARKS